ncbi:MAG: VWA domain-containing protein, partial [Betaproteobacteria bacterium]|nr:VWA domain-containing protein [Betaproteobacteria bacterium]
MQGVHAEGRLDGLMLAMTLRQRYRNDSQDNIEAVYTFPLAHGATLTGLEVRIGGKRLRAQVIAAPEARERFEDAIDAGDTPVMVEQTGTGLYTANLGNLLPGESLDIELEYAQLLRFEQGRIRLTVPTVIAERYGNPKGPGRLRP